MARLFKSPRKVTGRLTLGSLAVGWGCCERTMGKCVESACAERKDQILQKFFWAAGCQQPG